MRTCIQFFGLFLVSITGFAQTKIHGVVTDMAGQPLPLANVYLDGTYDGISTREDGSFEFITKENGGRTLVVSFTGFSESRTQIELKLKPVFVSIRLQEATRSLDAVTINAGAFTAGDQSRRTTFRSVDIATTAGATADIAGALNTLPGTQKVGESGRLFVRGGDASETRTFIDGMVVLDAYTPSAPDTPSRGRFLPFMFKGTSFSTGGYSAEYGQALSSALVLDSKDKSEINRTDIGILSVGADAGHTHIWDRGSLAGKMQYTNLRPYFGVIHQKTDWVNAPVSIEGHAAFRQQSGKHGLLKVYGNFNNSGFSLYNYDLDNPGLKKTYDLLSQYRYLNGSYRNLLNDNWLIRGGLSYTNVISQINSGSNLIDREENGLHLKTVFEGQVNNNLELKTGIEIIDHNYLQEENEKPAAFRESITSTFAEADLYVGNWFVTRAGLRAEYNALINHLSADPRLSLAYKTGSCGQVALAYGRFSQSPENRWLSINNRLLSEKADHYILNYQRVEDKRTLRIEAYYKKYSDLVKFIQGNPHELDNSGHGFARGVDFFWRDNSTLKNVDYWISYSFLDSQRNYLYFPGAVKPSFASTHNFSIVYKHFLTSLKSQVGLTFSYASGRPYYNPNQNDFNASQTPSYQDLSFNWSYLPLPSLIIYFSCTNLLGRDNIFQYEFSTEKNGDGLYNVKAIGPPARNFVFAAIFITISKEKSVNQLPNL